MKIVVNPQQIEIKHFLYSVIFFNDPAIKFVFFQPPGYLKLNPPFLTILSPKRKMKSPIGFFGWIFYFFGALYQSLVENIWFVELFLVFYDHNIIVRQKDIRKLLSDLKENGYKVDDKIKEYDNFNNTLIDKKFIVGTKAWYKKNMLFIILFIIFLSLVIFWDIDLCPQGFCP